MAALNLDLLRRNVVQVNGIQITVGAIVLIIVIFLIWKRSS